ncbi:hypothetical protein VUR80DRAFT_7168 [Thermomyces stellatus]
MAVCVSFWHHICLREHAAIALFTRHCLWDPLCLLIPALLGPTPTWTVRLGLDKKIYTKHFSDAEVKTPSPFHRGKGALEEAHDALLRSGPISVFPLRSASHSALASTQQIGVRKDSGFVLFGFVMLPCRFVRASGPVLDLVFVFIDLYEYEGMEKKNGYGLGLVASPLLSHHCFLPFTPNCK